MNWFAIMDRTSPAMEPIRDSLKLKWMLVFWTRGIFGQSQVQVVYQSDCWEACRNHAIRKGARELSQRRMEIVCWCAMQRAIELYT